MPYGICTAVSNSTVFGSTHYQWFECTPFEFGSTALKAWIPTWAVGRSFSKGISTNAVPEQSVGFFMGMYGSVFSSVVSTMLTQIPLDDDAVAQRFIKPLLITIQKKINSSRVLEGAKIPNFVVDMPTLLSPQEKILEIVDASRSCSIPLMPLLRPERALDIILVCDTSADIANSSLRSVQQLAQQQGFNLPAIDIAKASQQNISVFGDSSDLSAPVIVYVPLISNKQLSVPYRTFAVEKEISAGFARNTQTQYSWGNARLLVGFVEHNLLSHKAIIQNVIAQRLEALNLNTTKK